MKIVYKMKKVAAIMLEVGLVMGTVACSLEPKEGAAPSVVVDESKTTVEESMEIETMNTEVPETENIKTEISTSTAVDDEKADSATEGIVDGTTIIAMVDTYENNIIVLRDIGEEDIIYYFSTQNAQIIEGDTSIGAGDIVEITYRGVQGDEEHPGEAVKVVAESMMYK